MQRGLAPVFEIQQTRWIDAVLVLELAGLCGRAPKRYFKQENAVKAKNESNKVNWLLCGHFSTTESAH